MNLNTFRIDFKKEESKNAQSPLSSEEHDNLEKKINDGMKKAIDSFLQIDGMQDPFGGDNGPEFTCAISWMFFSVSYNIEINLIFLSNNQPYPIGEHIAIRPTKQTNTIIWHQNDPLDDVPIMSMQELMLPQLTEPIPILLSRTPSPQHDYNNNSFSPTLTDHHHHYCLNMMSPEDETNPISN
ncbi:870_t:CDS:2 [Entrophospora sp. SA101]|nr:870_t:CDS:2 [Entrophospora sp. SA101]